MVGVASKCVTRYRSACRPTMPASRGLGQYTAPMFFQSGNQRFAVYPKAWKKGRSPKILVPLGMLYTDVGRGVGLVSSFWMLLTPVVYPPPQTYPGSLVLWLNPGSPVLATCRDWFLLGSTSYFAGWLGVTIASLVLLLVGLVIYRLAMPILIERMSA